MDTRGRCQTASPCHSSSLGGSLGWELRLRYFPSSPCDAGRQPGLRTTASAEPPTVHGVSPRSDCTGCGRYRLRGFFETVVISADISKCWPQAEVMRGGEHPEAWTLLLPVSTACRCVPQDAGCVQDVRLVCMCVCVGGGSTCLQAFSGPVCFLL